MIPKWWGPRNLTTIVDKMDLKEGGLWRFINKDEKGEEYGFHGEYKEIVPPEKVVQTFEFEGMPGHIVTETMTLEEIDAEHTKMTIHSVFASPEDRTGMVNSGMEKGSTESYDRLAELLAK